MHNSARLHSSAVSTDDMDPSWSLGCLRLANDSAVENKQDNPGDESARMGKSGLLMSKNEPAKSKRMTCLFVFALARFSSSADRTQPASSREDLNSGAVYRNRHSFHFLWGVDFWPEDKKEI